VAFVTSIFPNPVEPTLGTFHGQLSRELRETCDLSVLSPQPWFPAAPEVAQLERWQRFGRIPREYSVEGVSTFSPKYLMVPGISEAVRPWLMYPELLRVASRLHRKSPIDVINGLWLYPDGVAAAKVAQRLGVPLVLTGLGCDVNICLDEPLKRPQIVAAAHQAHSIIVVSEPLKWRLVAEGVARRRSPSSPTASTRRRSPSAIGANARQVCHFLSINGDVSTSDGWPKRRACCR